MANWDQMDDDDDDELFKFAENQLIIAYHPKIVIVISICIYH